jgi:GT2 family glycosyltransferase
MKRESDMRIAVIVATLGRGETVSATLRYLLAHQTRQPDQIIISGTTNEDAGDLIELDGVTVVTGPKGLAAQRNTALMHLHPETDIVVFFDDDFVAGPNWLEAAVRVFVDESDVISLTGHVIADGINGPGLSFEDAVAAVEADVEPVPGNFREPFSPYGCNMAFRAASIGDQRFDERLVLYGWREDRDFGARVRRKGGRAVKYSGARGVHMGVKRARVAGDRLGYSQISNPVYMLGKGTMTPVQVADHIGRNLTANIVKAFVPEPYVDRRGRLRGNFLAIRDVLCGKVEPERAAQL